MLNVLLNQQVIHRKSMSRRHKQNDRDKDPDLFRTSEIFIESFIISM